MTLIFCVTNKFLLPTQLIEKQYFTLRNIFGCFYFRELSNGAPNLYSVYLGNKFWHSFHPPLPSTSHIPSLVPHTTGTWGWCGKFIFFFFSPSFFMKCQILQCRGELLLLGISNAYYPFSIRKSPNQPDMYAILVVALPSLVITNVPNSEIPTEKSYWQRAFTPK